MIPLHADPMQLAGGISMPLIGGGADPLLHVLPHEITKFGEFSFTNHILMMLVAAILLLIAVPLLARNKSLVPTGFRNFFEVLLQYIREEVARPLLGKATDKYIPILWTYFFFILTANLLGMIPFGAIAGLATQDNHFAHYIGGTATGNFMITGGLAAVAFVYIHVSGMVEQGAGKYWKNFFFGHAPLALSPLMIPIEAFGAVIKTAVLAVRLMANMAAGHIVLAVMGGFAAAGMVQGGGGYAISAVAILGSVAISLLELFVAFLQAYIFTFLVGLFIGMAIHTDH